MYRRPDDDLSPQSDPSNAICVESYIKVCLVQKIKQKEIDYAAMSPIRQCYGEVAESFSSKRAKYSDPTAFGESGRHWVQEAVSPSLLPSAAGLYQKSRILKRERTATKYRSSPVCSRAGPSTSKCSFYSVFILLKLQAIHCSVC